jgi:hypothetical protein
VKLNYNKMIVSSSSSNSNSSTIKSFYDNEEFDKLVKFLHDTRLESIGNTTAISKTFVAMEKKQCFDKINQILVIIAKYKIPVFDYELKEGVRILISAGKLHEVFDIFGLLIANKRTFDEYVMTSAISVCFTNCGNDIPLVEKCFNTIHSYFNINQSLSHSFWQTSIEGLIKLKMFKNANSLLTLYPVKYSYSETLWKNVIVSNMNNEEVDHVFNLFLEKYENRTNNDEFRAFENIFNIFIEELAHN